MKLKLTVLAYRYVRLFHVQSLAPIPDHPANRRKFELGPRESSEEARFSDSNTPLVVFHCQVELAVCILRGDPLSARSSTSTTSFTRTANCELCKAYPSLPIATLLRLDAVYTMVALHPSSFQRSLGNDSMSSSSHALTKPNETTRRSSCKMTN